MRRLIIIGIGAGDPGFVTLAAVEAMNRAQVFFMPDKGEEKAGLNRVRQQMLQRFVDKPLYRLADFEIPERRKAATPAYRESIEEWRAKVEAAYRKDAARHVYAGIGGRVRAAGCDSVTQRARTGRGAKLGWLALSVLRAGTMSVGPVPSVLHAGPAPEVEFLVQAARGVPRKGRSEALLSVLAQLEARDRGLA